MRESERELRERRDGENRIGWKRIGGYKLAFIEWVRTAVVVRGG